MEKRERVSIPVNIRVPLRMHGRWEERSETEGRTLASFVRHAVEAYLRAVGS